MEAVCRLFDGSWILRVEGILYRVDEDGTVEEARIQDEAAYFQPGMTAEGTPEQRTAAEAALKRWLEARKPEQCRACHWRMETPGICKVFPDCKPLTYVHGGSCPFRLR